MKPSKLGKKIKQYREEKKLTQQQLGDSIGVSWEMISKYERGINEPYNRIERIAKALDVEVSDLLVNENKDFGFNRIPLFVTIPKNREFIQENTSYFYTCPLWILEIDKSVFALDASLIEDSEKDKGVLYVSTKAEEKLNCFLLKYKEGSLYLSKKENSEQEDGFNIIGVVLSKEVRLY